jgi:predicted metallopeptidase
MYIFDGVEGSQNLRDVYDKLNKDYFGNSLPKIKVAWDGRLKRAIGRASVKWKTFMGAKPEIDISSLKITMSKSYDLSYQDTQAVMLHEMAHIDLFIRGDLSKHHGTPAFVGTINRLRKESGLNVPLKESSFKSSPKAKATQGFIAFIYGSGGVGTSVYSTPFINKNWKELGDFFQRFIPSKKIVRIELWSVKHPIIKNATKKRSLKRISWSKSEPTEVEEIKKSGFKWGEFSFHETWIDGKIAGLPGGRKITF